MPMIPPPTSNSTVHRWRVASAAGPPREFSSFIMRILFLPMDKYKTISILRVNQIDGSETIPGQRRQALWAGEDDGAYPVTAIRRCADRDPCKFPTSDGARGPRHPVPRPRT